MNSFFNRTTTVVLALITLLSITSCEPEIIDDLDDTNYNSEETLHENVNIIDSTQINLISDSSQLEDGIYIFEYSGDTPGFSTSDVIVGNSGDGYLRKIVDYSITGNTMTLNTEQATLEDLFMTSSNSIDLPSFTNNKSNSPYLDEAKIEYLIKGAEYSAEDGFIINDVNFDFGDGLDVKINSAQINFEENFKFDYNIEDSELLYVSFISENTKTSASYDYSINGAFTSSEPIKVQIARIRFPAIQVGLLRLGIRLRVYAQVESNDNLNINYNYSGRNNDVRDIGVEYLNGEVSLINNLISEEKLTTNSSVDISAGGMAKVSYVFEPELLIFGISTSYLSGGIYGQSSFNINTNADWDLNVKKGFEGKIGIRKKILGYTIPDISKNINYDSPNLYSMPHKLVYESGNNQAGSFNEELNSPIVVKVLDNMNDPAPFVPVYFEVTKGDGTLSEEKVFTNQDGIASTNWTLGGEDEDQNVVAKVKKGSGSEISGSPFNFNATVGQHPLIGKWSATTIEDQNIGQWYYSYYPDCPDLEDSGYLIIYDILDFKPNQNMIWSQKEASKSFLYENLFDCGYSNLTITTDTSEWETTIEYSISENQILFVEEGQQIPIDYTLTDQNTLIIYFLGDDIPFPSTYIRMED